MILAITIIFFLFGLVIGSFLNVVIYRYNTGRTFGGRSACMTCNRVLKWYELIPVFSFLAQKGKCSECHTRISIQYPLVEVTTGFIFAALFIKFQSIFWTNTTLAFSVVLAYYALLFSLLTVISVYDIRHKIIPDTLAFAFGALTFLGMFLFSNGNFHPHYPMITDYFAGPILALPFAALWLFSRGAWMGLGDAKLALGLGWMLGVTVGLSALMLSFWIGAIVGLILLATSKNHSLKSEIPFAPFLVFGAMIAFLFEINLFPFL